MLSRVLAERGVQLMTAPPFYQKAHELPGWYVPFKAHTAASVWLDHPGIDGLAEQATKLAPGPGVMKDWVKSMKHYWDEATFVPDVRDPVGLLRVAERFLELRGDDLIGGVVVRSFEFYEPGEIRSWWIGGRCNLISPHPDNPEAMTPDLDLGHLESAVASIGSAFVTVDLARVSDGSWRVVEVGDGQVSDRPACVRPRLLLAALERL